MTATTAALVVGLDASPSQAGSVSRSRYVLVNADFSLVDNAPAGEGIGDVMVQSYAVRSRGKEMGRAALTCTITDYGNALTCVGGLSLPTGTLAVAGISLGKGDTTTLPVVGGTGAWAGAQGFLVARVIAEGKQSLVISLVH